MSKSDWPGLSLPQMVERLRVEGDLLALDPAIDVKALSLPELFGTRDRLRGNRLTLGCPHCVRKFATAAALAQHVDDPRSRCYGRRAP